MSKNSPEFKLEIKTSSIRKAKKLFANALREATLKNDASAIAKLAVQAPDSSWLDARSDEGCTALCDAAAQGKARAALALLAAGASVEAQDEWGQGPLLMSCDGDNEKAWPAMTLLLLDAGANPNARNQVRQTALYWCVFRDDAPHLASARLLLARGANPDARDHSGRTPAHLAAQTRHTAMIEALAEGGARFDLKAGDGRDAAEFATYYGHHDIAALISTLELSRCEASELSKSIRRPKPEPARRLRTL